MPHLTRTPRNSVMDRPGRLKLLLRRQRHLLRPTIWAACALGAVLVIVLAVRSHQAGGALNTRDQLIAWTARAGLRVREIRVQGRTNTPETLLRTTLGVGRGDPILGFSVADTRARLQKLSWIEHATVERRLPGSVVVNLVERRPYAIWQNQGKFVVIDREGQAVADEDVGKFSNLPLVVGAGAPARAASLLDALTERPALLARVQAAVRVGERRWNLHLQSGTDVLLPAGAEIAALDRLSALQDGHALLDRPLQVVDMRLPDRLVLRAMADPHPADTTIPPIPPTLPHGAAPPRKST